MPATAKVTLHFSLDTECLDFVHHDTIEKMTKKLRGRSYYSVSYIPPPPENGGPILGGPKCAFIDQTTGDLITVERD